MKTKCKMAVLIAAVMLAACGGGDENKRVVGLSAPVAVHEPSARVCQAGDDMTWNGTRCKPGDRFLWQQERFTLNNKHRVHLMAAAYCDWRYPILVDFGSLACVFAKNSGQFEEAMEPAKAQEPAPPASGAK